MHQSSGVGGGSYCLLNMIRHLDRTRWEPVVALRGHGPLEEELHKLDVEVVLFPEMTGILYNHPMNLKNIRNYLQVLRSLQPCRRLLQRERIQVLYLNNMMIAPYLKPAKETGCRTVLHVREHWPGDQHIKQLTWVRELVYGYCDKLVAINHYSAGIFPQMAATVVYDGIDMRARYQPLPMESVFGEDMTGKKVLLYTGGVSAIKGVDYILDTFTKDIKGQEYRLLMLGCENFLNTGWRHRVKCLLSHFGYRYIRRELQEKANADPRVRGVESVYEITDLIEQAHCFVSYFRMPHANLSMAESIILGTPCIAADTEEAREYSGDGRYACLVSPLNDRAAFSAQLQRFLSGIEAWKTAAQEGSEELAGMFDPEENARRLNAVLQELCLC